MRIAVIGAGAVGGVIAALLERKGHDVVVTARGAGLTAIQSDGLHLSGKWGDHHAKLEAQTVLGDTPELAIVTTKAADTEAAVRANADQLAGVPILVVQNGLRGIDSVRSVLPDIAVLGGLALYAASYLTPGEVSVTTDGTTYIGGSDPEALDLISATIAEVMPVTVTPNFLGAQWTKLVVNQLNALPAITGTSAQAVIAHAGLRMVMTRSMRENVRVGRALGIRFATVQGLTPPILAALGALPAWIGQLVPLMMSARMGKTPNPGSTQQSIRRGQLSEIDYLNGAVVEAGVRAKVPTPINRVLTELVHEVERTGEFMEPTTVVERVTSAR